MHTTAALKLNIEIRLINKFKCIRKWYTTLLSCYSSFWPQTSSLLSSWLFITFPYFFFLSIFPFLYFFPFSPFLFFFPLSPYLFLLFFSSLIIYYFPSYFSFSFSSFPLLSSFSTNLSLTSSQHKVKAWPNFTNVWDCKSK